MSNHYRRAEKISGELQLHAFFLGVRRKRIAILPIYVAKNALKAGTLVPLLQDFPLQATWLKALIPRRRQGLSHIDALSNWLRQRLENAPPWGE
jgi:DNA-binding transcriptional LysR family regulator